MHGRILRTFTVMNVGSVKNIHEDLTNKLQPYDYFSVYGVPVKIIIGEN